ncbi:MAG: DUF4437 domain-containing protein [bacterium]|nr:DUF4437 domain-containing protein [bacterium]
MVTATFFAALAVGPIAASGASLSVSTPVTELKFGPTGVSDGSHRELYAAAAYGDLAHGAHGTFVKMPAGFTSKIHTHSEDYWGVVISGVAVNQKPGSPDIALPVGSYWFQKGGERHVTKCISPNECIFFINQAGKFDYLSDGTK